LILENSTAERDTCLHYPERIFSFFILEIFPKGAIQEILRIDSLLGRATKILDEFLAGEMEYAGKLPLYSSAV
jgi:hypothetical protein